MPNWCDNQFVVEGSKKQIDDLFDMMNAAAHPGGQAQEAPTLWLCDLYEMLGADESVVAATRGHWGGPVRIDDNTMRFWTETAWGPYGDFIDLLEAYSTRDADDDTDAESVGVLYLYEEGGNDIYLTNDVEHRFFKDTCILTVDDETEYLDDEGAFSRLSEIAGGTIEGWDQAEKFIEDYEDSEIYITRLEYD